MQVSKDGVNLTERMEGLRLKAYRDGGGVLTIGYGHILGVEEGMEISQVQAEAYLREDVQRSVDDINRLVTISLTQGEFDALVDFDFNLGGNALKGSTLLKKLNSGDYQGAEQEFIRWNHDNGKVVEGLTKRRVAEQDEFK